MLKLRHMCFSHEGRNLLWVGIFLMFYNENYKPTDWNSKQDFKYPATFLYKCKTYFRCICVFILFANLSGNFTCAKAFTSTLLRLPLLLLVRWHVQGAVRTESDRWSTVTSPTPNCMQNINETWWLRTWRLILRHNSQIQHSSGKHSNDFPPDRWLKKKWHTASILRNIY